MELLQKYYEGKIQNLSEAEEEEMSNVKDEVSTSSGSRGGFMAPPSPEADQGFLERGVHMYKGVAVRFTDLVSFYFYIP